MDMLGKKFEQDRKRELLRKFMIQQGMFNEGSEQFERILTLLMKNTVGAPNEDALRLSIDEFKQEQFKILSENMVFDEQGMVRATMEPGGGGDFPAPAPAPAPDPVADTVYDDAAVFSYGRDDKLVKTPTHKHSVVRSQNYPIGKKKRSKKKSKKRSKKKSKKRSKKKRKSTKKRSKKKR